MKIQHIIPSIVAYITNTQRYKPTIEWSSTSITHNVFRVYELICWRKYGIRAEASTFEKIIDGKIIVMYEYYTFEASCGAFEAGIRAFIKRIKNFNFKNFFPYKIYIPALQTNTGFNIRNPYLFAIGVDLSTTTTAPNTGSPRTITIHSISGSDRLLWVTAGCHTSLGDVSAVTHDAGAMTQTGTDITDGSNGRLTIWYRAAPSTGAKDVVITATGAANIVHGASSFTGCDQTTIPDATPVTTTTSGGTTASFTQTITVANANSFLFSAFYAWYGNTITGGTNTTIASQPEASFHGAAMIHSTASVSTGSQSLNVTCTAQPFDATLVSFAPTGGGSTRKGLALLGVGQ